MQVGYPWRDLPAKFGCWNSIYKKFNRWSSNNQLMEIFQALVKEPDLEWKFIDGSIVKAHQHSADAFGLPIAFELTGGNADFTIADKGYDRAQVREAIEQKASVHVIPRKNNSKIGSTHMDWLLYKYRHLIENLFARLKHFRSIATIFDKLKHNYAAMLALGNSLLSIK